MGYGDELIAAGQARQIYESTRQRVLILDQDRRARWHPIWDGNPAILRPEQATGRDVQSLVNGPECRPYIVYPFTAESGWTFNPSFRCRENIAKIYLTPAETAIGARLRRQFGPYTLIEPWSKHHNLRWPLNKWQELVESRPRTFIQHVHKDTGTCIVQGIPLIHTTTFREACGVLLSADVYIRGESGMCHAAAALDIPNIVIWGGCMDWDVMAGYPKQVGVGITPPFCGSYKRCEHCIKIMAGIPVDAVLAELDKIGVE